MVRAISVSPISAISLVANPTALIISGVLKYPMFIKLSGSAVILTAQAAAIAAAAAKKLGSKKLAICEIALSILALLMLIPIELRTALVK